MLSLIGLWSPEARTYEEQRSTLLRRLHVADIAMGGERGGSEGRGS
jgi:hypothetical protein